MEKKDFIKPEVKVVKIQATDIVAASCEGQACFTEVGCETEFEG